MTIKQAKWLIITIISLAIVGILILFGLKVMKFIMAFIAGMLLGAVLYHITLKKFDKKTVTVSN